MTASRDVGSIDFIGNVDDHIIVGFSCWSKIEGAKYRVNGSVQLLYAHDICDTLIWTQEADMATVIFPAWLQ